MAYTYRHGDRPLEGYTIQRAVGRGGFGEVYYAVSDSGREIALKYLRENPDIELRGVSYCMNLKSPHLVSIFDVKANADGEYFVVMEYVAGPSLRDLLLAEPNGLGPQKSAFFVREIAKGLAYLHDRGIVHRDLKPGNIFYDEGYVKIGDYGLSKFISVSRHSAQTASIGTVHYMAPEVGSGNYHRGIDIYALGVMLYEMLLGKVPFEGSSMGEVLMKHLTVQPEVDNLPAPFGKVIRKALEKDPADRYQTIYEMVDDLLEVEDVQHSLAGFNPASLAAVERRGSADPSDSPAPSPNPAPRRLPVQPAERGYDLDARPLPANVARRVAAIGDRVDKRVRKLDAKHGSRTPRAPEPAGGPAPVLRAHDNAARTRGEVIQRLLLALAMAVALGMGLGFLVDAREGGFVSSIMMIVGMSGGLCLGARLFARASRYAPQPQWVERACLTAPVAAFIGIGVAPFADRPGNEDAALGVWVALVIVTLLVNWRGHARTGARGAISLWQTGKVALLALIGTSIFAARFRHGDSAVALGVGVAAATSLVVQALAWLFPILSWLEGAGAPAPTALNDATAPVEAHRLRAAWQSARESFAAHRVPNAPAESAPPTSPVRAAEGSSAVPSGYGAANSFVITGPPARSWITRLFAGLTFLTILGVMMGIASALAGTSDEPVIHTIRNVGGELTEVKCYAHGWRVSAAAAVAGSFGLLLMAGRKMRRYRTGGFYRDTLRPMLMTIVLAGMAAMGTALTLTAPNVQPAWGVLVLLILFSMAFLFLLFKRGQRYSFPPQPEVEQYAQAAYRDSASDATPAAR